MYKHWSKNKGRKYAECVPIPYEKPCFNVFLKTDREEITTFCRMRSKSEWTMSHMYRIDVKNTDAGSCGESLYRKTQNLPHVFFKCIQNMANTSNLMSNLKIPTNFTYPLMLAYSENILLIQFLHTCRLKV